MHYKPGHSIPRLSWHIILARIAPTSYKFALNKHLKHHPNWSWGPKKSPIAADCLGKSNSSKPTKWNRSGQHGISRLDLHDTLATPFRYLYMARCFPWRASLHDAFSGGLFSLLSNSCSLMFQHLFAIAFNCHAVDIGWKSVQLDGHHFEINIITGCEKKPLMRKLLT